MWPVGLVGLAVVLFGVAAAQYPGGYSWLQQSISSLFQPLTVSGEANRARPVAILAVLAFCAGIAWRRCARRPRCPDGVSLKSERGIDV